MFFPEFGYIHGSDCFKIMDAETGRVVHLRDVTWHPPREPLISSAPTVESGVPYPSLGTESPYCMYIQPPLVATDTPATAPAFALAAATPMPASAVIALAPAPPPNPPAPIPDCVVRKLGHEADVPLPRRKRGETRAMRDSYHSMGLTSYAALAQKSATREAFDEAFKEHDLPKAEIDLLTAPASNIQTPSTVAEAEASEHAEIRRGSRVQEFSDLLQAHRLSPA